MDESAKIDLSRPVNIDGVYIDTLTMREPTVGDQMAADEKHPASPNSIREVTLFANLCEVPVDAIASLRLKDYQKLQDAYSGFL